LISGFAVFLFRNVDDMMAAWKRGCPDDLGGLNVGYDIITMEPTAIASGHDVADSPGSFDSRGCLGLRIRLRNGTDAVTTVTHGFVKLPKHSRVFLRMADWYLQAKEH
jgi:hypothetical protein